MLQLMQGMAVSFIFLLLQMQSQPFRDKGDQVLALFTGASLVTLFYSCTLLRSTELADIERVDALLTDDLRDAYAISAGLVFAVLTCSSILALALAVPVLLVSLRVQRDTVALRWAKDGWRVVPRKLPGGQFHTFLSHKWSSGQDQARSVKALLQDLVPGIKCWLDVDNMRSKAGTSGTDKESFVKLIDEQHSVIAFLTGDTLAGGKQVRLRWLAMTAPALDTSATPPVPRARAPRSHQARVAATPQCSPIGSPPPAHAGERLLPLGPLPERDPA